MWLDSTTSDQGYIPLRLPFLDWYELWLDETLLDPGPYHNPYARQIIRNCPPDPRLPPPPG